MTRLSPRYRVKKDETQNKACLRVTDDEGALGMDRKQVQKSRAPLGSAASSLADQ